MLVGREAQEDLDGGLVSVEESLLGGKALLLAIPMENIQAGHLQTSVTTSPSSVK